MLQGISALGLVRVELGVQAGGNGPSSDHQEFCRQLS